ncbi:MAG: hypothetical protein GEV07_27860 [Streptosporangiales bacterium]|nr:hypothetical protein [Streptosporangiales bacterium]
MTSASREPYGFYAFVRPWVRSVRLEPGGPLADVQGLTALVTLHRDTPRVEQFHARISDPDGDWRREAAFAQRPDVRGIHTAIQSTDEPLADPLRNQELMERFTHQLSERYGVNYALVESGGNRPNERHPSGGAKPGSILVAYGTPDTTETIGIVQGIESSLDNLEDGQRQAAGPLAAHLAGGQDKFRIEVVEGTPNRDALQQQLNGVVARAGDVYKAVKDSPVPTAHVYANRDARQQRERTEARRNRSRTDPTAREHRQGRAADPRGPGG